MARRWTWATHTEVQVLSRALLVVAPVALFTAVVPFSATAPVRLALLMSGVAVVLGLALRRFVARTPVVIVHAVVTLASLLSGVCIARSTTPAGTVLTSFAVIWIGLYSALFHQRGAMVRHLALLVVVLGWALVAAPAVPALQTWVFVSSMTVAVSWILNAKVDVLRARADRDPLTDALTRATFRARAERSMALARAHGSDLTLVLIDLDGFKLVNDSRGHAAGDRMLEDHVREWRSALRQEDLLGRHGGDEFVVLLGDMGADGADAVVRRLREVTTDGTWSAGTATWAGEEFDAWLARADADLYAEKAVRVVGATVRR